MRDRIARLGRDTRIFAVRIDRRTLDLNGEVQHVAHLGDLPRRFVGIHVHVALQEHDTLGQHLDVPHLGNGHFVQITRQILVTRILQMNVEIHILQRRGYLLAHGVIEHVDALLILVFGVFHNEKIWNASRKTHSKSPSAPALDAIAP